MRNRDVSKHKKFCIVHSCPKLFLREEEESFIQSSQNTLQKVDDKSSDTIRCTSAPRNWGHDSYNKKLNVSIHFNFQYQYHIMSLKLQDLSYYFICHLDIIYSI